VSNLKIVSQNVYKSIAIIIEM